MFAVSVYLLAVCESLLCVKASLCKRLLCVKASVCRHLLCVKAPLCKRLLCVKACSFYLAHPGTNFTFLFVQSLMYGCFPHYFPPVDPGSRCCCRETCRSKNQPAWSIVFEADAKQRQQLIYLPDDVRDVGGGYLWIYNGIARQTPSPQLATLSQQRLHGAWWQLCTAALPAPTSVKADPFTAASFLCWALGRAFFYMWTGNCRWILSLIFQYTWIWACKLRILCGYRCVFYVASAVNFEMRRCEELRMWRCEDEKMWRIEDVKVWRWEDVKMRRWVEKMWWEDEKMRREDLQMWWEDAKMRKCMADFRY